MKCENAQQNMIFAGYGELHDEQVDGLEEHLASCAACRAELEALQKLQQTLALHPMQEPSPNLLAQARMRLDEELDSIPAHGFFTHVRSLFFGSLASIRTSPALSVLLIGIGVLGGRFVARPHEVREPLPPRVVVLEHNGESSIANISGIVSTPNSEIVQVRYNRITPESMEGSLDQPEIRKLLMIGIGSTDGTPNSVRESSVELLAHECKAGHRCQAETDGAGGIRNALMTSLRYDKSPAVRLKALEGLKAYVASDKRVRDAVLECLSHDPSSTVRAASVDLIQPVQSDSSVRQVLRTVSTQDQNPYIRTASYKALQNSSDIQ